MKYILDTHTLLWAASNPEKISKIVSGFILNIGGNIYISAVSIWEISIKININKLSIGNYTIENFIKENCNKLQLKVLPILSTHLYKVSSMENHHKDPFDRLIIAQSQCTNFPIHGSDIAFDDYLVNRIW